MNYALFLNLLAALYLIHFKDKSITEVFADGQHLRNSDHSSTPKPRISPTEANTFTPTSTPTTSSNRTEEIQAENRTSERMQKINSTSKNEIQNLTTANFTHMTDLHERTQISPSPNATISQALSEHKILTLTTLKNATIDNLHANIFSATPKLSEDIDNSTANSIPHLSQMDVMSASTFQTRQIEETNPTSNIIKNIYNKVTADSVVNISSSTFGGSASSVIPAETEVATTPKTAVDSEKTLTLNLRITIQTSSFQQKTLAENITKYMPSSETGNPSSTKQITTSQMQNSEPITTRRSTATVSGSTAALNQTSSVKLNVRSDPNQVTPFIKSVSTTSASPQTESSVETAKETGITSITKQIPESTATLYSNKVTNTAPLTERSNNNVTMGTKATTSIETENEFVNTNLSWTWEETTLAKIADSDRTQQSLPSEETPAPTPAQTFLRTTPRKTQKNATAGSTVTFMQSMTNSLTRENTDVATPSTMVTKEEGSSIDQFTQKSTKSAGSVTTTSVTPTQAMPSIAKPTKTQWHTTLNTFQSIPEGTTKSPKRTAFLTGSTTSEMAPSKTNEWYTTLNHSVGSTDDNSSTPSHGESVTNTLTQTTTTSVATLQGLSSVLTPAATQSETPAGATPSETAKSVASLMSKSATSITEPSTGGNETYGSSTSRHTTPTNSTSGSITTGVTTQTAGSVNTLAITTPTQSGPLTADIHASTTALTSTQMAASITATPTEPIASTKESVTTTRQTTSDTETGFTTPTKTTVPTSADQGNTTSLTSNSTPTPFQTTSNQRTLSGKTLSGQSTGDEKTNMQTETSILKSTEIQTDVPKPTFTESYTSEGTTLQPPATASTNVSPTSVTRQATKKEGSSIDRFTQELTKSAGSVTTTSVTATQAMPSIAKSTTTQNTSLETFQSIPEGTTESPKRMAFLTGSTTSEKIDLFQLTSRSSTSRLISSTNDLSTTSAQTSSYVATPTEISAAVTTNPSFSEELTNPVTAHITPMNLRTATSSVRTQSALIDPSSNLASVTSKSSTTMTHSASTLHQNTNVAATSVSLSSDGTPSQRTGTATNEDANSSFTPSPSPVTRVFSGNIPATVTFSSLPSTVMVSQTTAAIDSSSSLPSPVSTEQSPSNPAQANSTGPQLNSTSFPSSMANILFFKHTPKIATLTPLVFDYPIVNRISFPASNASNSQEQSQNNTNKAGST